MIIVRPSANLFPPVGMYRTATANMESTTYIPIPSMAANPNLLGSVVSSNALVCQSAGEVRVAFSAVMKPGDSAVQYVSVFKNGVPVSGSEVSAAGKYNGASVFFGSVVTTVNSGDVIDLRWRKSTGTWAVSMLADYTRMNITSSSILPAGATTTAAFSPSAGWTDVPNMSADSGTTLNGNSLVVPSTNPGAILAASTPANVNDTTALRFLINDVVAYTGPTIPAYDQTIWAVASVAVNAGDLVRVQYNRGSFAASIAAGFRFMVL